ncbi:hypothetical protein [Rhizobium mongolense]|uniref:hypothetical protein n=1 Tax=Rhizobium mongolense TaxID=57676 RepID=UPI0034A50F65
MPDLKGPFSRKDWITFEGRRVTRSVGFFDEGSQGLQETASFALGTHNFAIKELFGDLARPSKSHNSENQEI